MAEEHEFLFNVSIDKTVSAYFEEEEYQDFAEEGESREDFARRRAQERAARDLTMRIADDGLHETEVSIEDVAEHLEY